MKLNIYHYKDNNNWVPFFLNKKYGLEWNKFCKKIALSRPNDPDPNYNDYIEFLDE